MKGRSWLADHLEGFVKDYLGYIPDISSVPSPFSKEEMAVIKNIWRSVKKASAGKLLVLPGRDVFIFEVLARRENFPTLFLPACSRASVEHFFRNSLVPTDSFILDTGFMGTIPRKLCVDNFVMVSSHLKGRHVFPRLTMSRNLALRIEKTPKYWQTGKLSDGELIQELSGTGEFIRAAVLTQRIYKDSSPSFIDRAKPLGDDSWRSMW